MMSYPSHPYSYSIAIALFLLAVLPTPFRAGAQQLPQFALTPWTLVEMNPAATGAQDELIFNGAARRQWNNLPGSPSGYHISAHMPLPAIQSGVGVSLLQDQIGLQTQLEATVTYAYHMPLGRRWTLHGGLAAGLFQSGLDGSGIRTPDGQYPDGGGLDHQDGFLPNGAVNATAPLLHAGIMIDDEVWQFGTAMRYAQGGNLKYSGADEQAAMSIQPHLLAHASWSWETGNAVFRPTAMFLSDFRHWQLTTQLNLIWRERFILGGGYRGLNEDTRDSLLVTAGLYISERFLFLYAYEAGLSELRQVHNGSFEVMIQYRLPSTVSKGKLPGIIYNPRFL